MSETITLEVQLRAFVRRENRRRWVAVCPSIGVASQGDSAEDAKRSLDEAVQAWFESCIERGVLDQALREANFRPLLPGQTPPTDAERVMLSRSTEPDVLGAEFPIHVEIPAYQASAFLSNSAV